MNGKLAMQETRYESWRPQNHNRPIEANIAACFSLNVGRCHHHRQFDLQNSSIFDNGDFEREHFQSMLLTKKKIFEAIYE